MRQSLHDLVVEHLPQVHLLAKVIHKRLPPHVDFNDLIGYGTIGLLDAAKKFRRTRGVKFRTYAEHRIKGAIIDGLRGSGFGAARSRTYNRRVPIDRLKNSPSLLGEPFSSCHKKQVERIIRRTIERLPKKERLVVMAYYYDRKTHREIARVLGTEEPWISLLHSAAIDRLGKRLRRVKGEVLP